MMFHIITNSPLNVPICALNIGQVEDFVLSADKVFVNHFIGRPVRTYQGEINLLFVSALSKEQVRSLMSCDRSYRRPRKQKFYDRGAYNTHHRHDF